MQPEDHGRLDRGRDRDEARSGRRHTRKTATVRRYHKFTRYVLIPGLVLLLLGISSIFLRAPVMNRVRQWKSDQLIATAEQEYKAGRLMDVHRKLQVALQLSPLNPKVQRLAARFYTEVNVPEALNHWQIVITAPDASVEDRLAYLDACLQFLRADLAVAELNSLETTIAKSPDFLRRVVRYMVLVNDFAAAVPYAREAQGINPKDEEFEFLLGMCLVRSGEAALAQEGRRLLFGIAIASGSQQSAAARELIATGTLTSVEGRQIARALERRTDLQFADRLDVAGLRMSGDIAERERVARSLGEEQQPKDDAERIAYGSWLLRMQVPSVAKAFLLPLVTTNSTLASLRAESLAVSGSWDDLDRVLEQDSKVLPPSTLAGTKAYRAASKGDLDQANAILNSAIDSISMSSKRDSVSELNSLSLWAERAQQTNMAMKALVPLLPIRSVLPIAGRRILVLSAGADSLELTLPALRALRGYAPNDRSVMVAYSHVCLIFNENVDESASLVDQLLEMDPDKVVNRVLAAFAKYRQGKMQEALESLEQRPVDTSLLDPRFKALVAMVRHGAGQRDAARQLAREALQGKLKLEERKMLESIQ